MSVAGVAHLVERHLAKVEVAGSSPVTRSIRADAFSICSFLQSTRAQTIEFDTPVDCRSSPA